MKEVILKISNNFSFSYGANKIFSSKTDISFEKGKVYGIYGSNGTGKTTFLNIINSLIPPTKGSIKYYFGNSSFIFNSKNNDNTVKIISNNIRRCFQTPILNEELSIIDNIILGKREYQNERFISSIYPQKENIQEGILDLLSQLNINPENTPDKLSYGQSRIIANLQIIYSSPTLILLDEPFAGLHSTIIKLLKEKYIEKKENGATIIIVEHKQKNLTDFVDEYFVIKNKELLKHNVGIN